MELSNVSKTAISTLRGRVIESRKPHPLIQDPLAEICLARLEELAGPEELELLFRRKLTPQLTGHFALRARKYDRIANEFIAARPGCTVINLGCGFDTRFWRIDHSHCTYLELDLPELVALKREILADHLEYELIGSSVLDPGWLELVSGKTDCLLLAEGLFMYLPGDEVLGLFRRIAQSLSRSQISMELVTESYTRGLWKKIVIMKLKQELGFDFDGYGFGVRNSRELEGLVPGFKIIDEWFYMEDPDARPRFLKYLGLSRTQWTVTVRINA